MPRGGKRANSGRKKGSEGAAKKKSRARIKEILDAGLDPVEVMLDVMRRHYKARRWDKAASIAKDVAPYCKPRLASVTHKGDEQKPIRLVEEFVIVDGNPNPSPQTPS